MEKLERILLIDDDPISSWLNKTIIEKTSVAQEISCLDDGKTAAEYLQNLCHCRENKAGEKMPDLIFLDLNMPEFDGFQVLEHLQQQEACEWLIRERIVVLTTSISKLDYTKASDYHVQNYLVKPLSEEKVKQVVARMLGKETLSEPSGDRSTGLNDKAPAERDGVLSFRKTKNEPDQPK